MPDAGNGPSIPATVLDGLNSHPSSLPSRFKTKTRPPPPHPETGSAKLYLWLNLGNLGLEVAVGQE